jgi:hypothetical protein
VWRPWCLARVGVSVCGACGGRWLQQEVEALRRGERRLRASLVTLIGTRQASGRSLLQGPTEDEPEASGPEAWPGLRREVATAGPRPLRPEPRGCNRTPLPALRQRGPGGDQGGGAVRGGHSSRNATHPPLPRPRRSLLALPQAGTGAPPAADQRRHRRGLCPSRSARRHPRRRPQ